MKLLSPVLALLFLIPTQALGFALALDQPSANNTFFVAARVGETTTLTAFADETSKKWLVLTPPGAAFSTVARIQFHDLEIKTRPLVQQMTESDPCVAANSLENGSLKPDQKYTPSLVGATAPASIEGGPVGTIVPWNKEAHHLFESADLQSYLSEGWVLRVVELEKPGEGIQFSYNSERLEIPPRPASGKLDRGELSLILIADTRIEPVNFKSQLPPTNIEIRASEPLDTQSLDQLLAAVFAEVDKNESGAFITEFALDVPRWDFNPPLRSFSSAELPEAKTVTRLRRLGDLGKFSAPIQLFPAFRMAGGDDVELGGRLRSGGYSSDRNDFRTRLVIRKSFDRNHPVSCENPAWDRWVSHSLNTLRGGFEPESTDEVRARLFQAWLSEDVPEIYWSPRPQADSKSELESKSPIEPAGDKTQSQCAGCATTESSTTIAALLALLFIRWVR